MFPFGSVTNALPPASVRLSWSARGGAPSGTGGSFLALDLPPPSAKTKTPAAIAAIATTAATIQIGLTRRAAPAAGHSKLVFAGGTGLRPPPPALREAAQAPARRRQAAPAGPLERGPGEPLPASAGRRPRPEPPPSRPCRDRS